LTTPVTHEPTRAAALARVALGLFILWQLVFLVASNATSFLLLYTAETGDALRPITATTDGWASLTGQAQNWRLFAPLVPMRSLFLQVDFHGPDGAARVSSEFEPADATCYFHLPGCGDRLWHVEKTLAWPCVAYDPDAVAARPDEWRAYLDDRARANDRAARAYLAWKRRAFERDHPALPSRAIDLGVRIYSRSHQPDAVTPEAHQLLLHWEPPQTPALAEATR
jgi:hypothetical protein